ncbi:hypothetical protein P154DRAFT_617447 [Amniculicola lignicola CBS 123094]|uniref:AA1-like domain-containing protein n=1 Tax=Amniculicola lignicola CBS 123094 TaxID=1392246 RepID=A0A6A5WUF5_9PLEO|nr:hypothetical protein P154DRAFT_617447 [Amniculicola lignicola CBS 123094]
MSNRRIISTTVFPAYTKTSTNTLHLPTYLSSKQTNHPTMYLSTILPIAALILTSTSAHPQGPTPLLLAKRADPVFTVTDFSASLSSTPGSLDSTVSFTFTDPRPEHSLSIPCSASGTIYRDGFTKCGGDVAPDSTVTFRLSEGQLVVRRRWQVGRYTFTGEAPQGTYWNYGAGGNATRTEAGTTFTRTTDWAFPVKSLSSFGK